MINGLTSEQLQGSDRPIIQAADHLEPCVYVFTEVVSLNVEGSNKYVLVINVKEGVNKPHRTPKGEVFIKQGASRRQLTDNKRIMRWFENSGNLLLESAVDEMEVYGTSIEDVNEKLFSDYFKKEFGRSYQERGRTFEQALKAKRILRNNQVTLAGLLFFGTDPQATKPAFTIKAVAYVGNDLSGNQYRSKPNDLAGTIPELFGKGMDFFHGSLHFTQSGKSFNSPGN